MPSYNNIKSIIEIVNKECPDIIHIWGVENYWGLLISKGYIKPKISLLEIQGVLEACYDFYMQDLCFDNFKSTMNLLKALYSYSFVLLQKKRMKSRIRQENEIIQAFDNIAYQSEWVKNWIRYKNPKAKLFESKINDIGKTPVLLNIGEKY